jgi:hypothetical protein
MPDRVSISGALLQRQLDHRDASLKRPTTRSRRLSSRSPGRSGTADVRSGAGGAGAGGPPPPGSRARQRKARHPHHPDQARSRYVPGDDDHRKGRTAMEAGIRKLGSRALGVSTPSCTFRWLLGAGDLSELEKSRSRRASASWSWFDSCSPREARLSGSWASGQSRGMIPQEKMSRCTRRSPTA